MTCVAFPFSLCIICTCFKQDVETLNMSEYDAHKWLLIDAITDCDKVNKKKGIREKFKFLVDKEVIEGDTNDTQGGINYGDEDDPTTWQILD